jgi:hydroxylamine reductase
MSQTQTDMFCWQCEQTAQGKGCTRFGVCGKTPQVARLQDLLVYASRGLSEVAQEAKRRGITDEATDVFVCEVVFATLTNVNFDHENIISYLKTAVEKRETLKTKLAAAAPTHLSPAANFSLADLGGHGRAGKQYGITPTPP